MTSLFDIRVKLYLERLDHVEMQFCYTKCIYVTNSQTHENNSSARHLNEINVPYHFKYIDIKRNISPVYCCSPRSIFDLWDATHVHQ